MQWLGLALVLAILAGLTYAFVRHGVKIKPDPESKPPTLNAE
jgi:hypothetical protein